MEPYVIQTTRPLIILSSLYKLSLTRCISMHPVSLYLIHGIDKSRGPRMIEEFKKAGIDPSGVQWILHPNKDELTYEFLCKNILSTPSYIATQYIPGGPHSVPLGVASCTYKHYLALEDIVKNKYPYAVIMEDNMQFAHGVNVPERIQTYINQLNSLYPGWDVLFDLKNGPRDPDNTYVPETYVYPRKHTHASPWHGGARCAQFYLLSYQGALKLYSHYIPFNSAPDAWMCELFRKLDMKVFWAEPNAVEVWQHTSTAN